MAMMQPVHAQTPVPARGRAHVEVTSAFLVDLAASRAFTLVEPEGERRWAVGWDPEPVWAPDGVAARGMVFRTRGDHDAPHAVWQIVKHDPAAGEISYASVREGRRATLIDIRVVAVAPSRTRIEVSYAVTSLVEAEDDAVRAFGEGYEAYLREWETAIRRHVVQGVPIGPP